MVKTNEYRYMKIMKLKKQYWWIIGELIDFS